MDMSRLDRSAARPLGGPAPRALREQPEPPPVAGERPLREMPAAADRPVFALDPPAADAPPTTAELLLILREVLGDQAVGLADGADILLLDQPLLDQFLPDQPDPEAPRTPRPPTIQTDRAAAEERPRITTDGLDDSLDEAPIFGPAPGFGLIGRLCGLMGR